MDRFRPSSPFLRAALPLVALALLVLPGACSTASAPSADDAKDLRDGGLSDTAPVRDGVGDVPAPPVDIRDAVVDAGVDAGADAGADAVDIWDADPLDTDADLDASDVPVPSDVRDGSGCAGDEDCDDGFFCNGAERCGPEGACLPGDPPCDDSVECTEERCSEETDACERYPRHALCGAGERCDAGAGCTAAPPLPGQTSPVAPERIERHGPAALPTVRDECLVIAERVVDAASLQTTLADLPFDAVVVGALRAAPVFQVLLPGIPTDDTGGALLDERCAAVGALDDVVSAHIHPAGVVAERLPTAGADADYMEDGALGESAWHLDAIGAPAAWDTTVGDADLRIGVLDTGFRSDHPDLLLNVVGCLSPAGTVLPCGSGWTAPPADAAGAARDHGTLVAGLIAAAGDTAHAGSADVVGVLWHAGLVLARPGGDLMSWASAAENLAAEGVDLLNVSAGFAWNPPGADPSDPTSPDADALVATHAAVWGAVLTAHPGLLVVQGAGNEGAAGVDAGHNLLACAVSTPGLAARVLCVPSARPDGSLSPSSNPGGDPLAAPGGDDAGGVVGLAFEPEALAEGGGTSFAAAITTGVAGLVWSADPTLTAAQVADLLLHTGVEGEAGEDVRRLDAAAAVEGAVLCQANDWDPDVHGCPEPPPPVEVTCYRDTDRDGRGVAADDAVFQDACPGGWSLVPGDCDDTDVLRHEGAFELPDDGVDQDCDGVDLVASDDVGVFVSPTGDDQNPGTMAEPVASLWVGIGNATAAEKVVFVATGTYYASTSPTVSVFGGYEDVTWTRDIAANETRVEAYLHEPFRVEGEGTAIAIEGFTLTGRSSTPYPAGRAVFVDEGASLLLAHSSVEGGYGESTAGLDTNHAARVVVVGNTIDGGSGGSTTAGVKLTGVDSFLVVGNTIDGGGQFGGADASHGIWAIGGAGDVLDNDVTGGWGDAWSYGVRYSNGARGAIVGNRVVGSEMAWGKDSNGVTVGEGEAFLANNVVDGGFGTDDTYGVRISLGRATLVHNTIDGGGLPQSNSTGLQVYDSVTAVVDNILYGGRGRHGFTQGVTGNYALSVFATSAEVTLAGNVLWSDADGGCLVLEDPAVSGTVHISRCVNTAEWLSDCTWTGCVSVSAATVGDPRFADYAQTDRRIWSDSPAVDAGVDPSEWTDDASVAVDPWGDPRPWGAGYDAGADEYAGVEPILPGPCYRDADDDGDGDPDDAEIVVGACPDGRVRTGTDCDDDDPMRHAGAPELLDDGVDQDCDGGDLSAGEDIAVFVAPSGDDGNPGTREAPLATIQAGVDRAAETDRDVVVAGGLYEEDVAAGVSIHGGYDAFDWTRDVATNLTVLRAAQETALTIRWAPKTVVVDGLSLQGGAHAATTTGLDTWGAELVVASCQVDGGAGANASVGVSLGSDSTAVLVDNDIDGGTGANTAKGVYADIESHVVLRGNRVYGGGRGGASTFSTGVELRLWVTGLVEDNAIEAGGATRTAHGVRVTDICDVILVRNVVTGGVRALTSDGVSCGTATLRAWENEIHGGVGATETVGADLRDCDSQLAGNVIFGGLGRAYAAAVRVEERAATLVGNTLDAGGDAPAASHALTVTDATVELVDNVLIGGDSPTERAALRVAGTWARTRLHGNLLWDTTPGCLLLDVDAETCLESVQALEACDWSGCLEPPTDILTSDPRIVLRAARDYHLWSSSPAVDAGVDPATWLSEWPPEEFAPRDLDGDARPYGAAWDLGADEWTGGGDDPALQGDGECFRDDDGDGYGAGTATAAADGCAAGQVRLAGDCDDGAPTTHPGAVEVPDDGVDQDCDGADLDEQGGGAEPVTCYRDADADGHGGLSTSAVFGGRCPQGWVATADDCDDADVLTHADALDLPDDGVDQDCDGADRVRSDADGVFVSPNGDDEDPGTMEAPKATLWAANSLAIASGRDIFLAGGTYQGDIVTTVSLFGGYEDGGWTRDIAANETVVESVWRVPVTLQGAGARAAVDGLTLRGDTTGYETGTTALFIYEGVEATVAHSRLVGGAQGREYTYGLRVRDDCRVVLVDNDVSGGDGSDITVALDVESRSEVTAVGNRLDGGGQWGHATYSVGAWIRTDCRGTFVDNDVTGGWGQQTAFGVRVTNGALGRLVGNRIGGGEQAGGAQSRGVEVGYGAADLVNNVIDGGFGTERSVGVTVAGGSATLAHNSIGGGGEPAGESFAVMAYDCAATLVGNLLDGGRGQTIFNPNASEENWIVANYALYVTFATTELLFAGNDLWSDAGGCLVMEDWTNGPLHIFDCIRDFDEFDACAWTGCAWTDGNVSVDPGVVDRAAGDFRLWGDSALVDAGLDPTAWSDASELATDADGDPRPWGAGWDIGADEFAGIEPEGPTVCHRDADGDGSGDPDVSYETEPLGSCDAGWVTDAGDCDDDDPLAHHGAPDLPGDGGDQDCDGADFAPSDDVGVFVAPDGDDAGPGTMAAPLATVGAAVTRAADEGKVVFVAAGLYEEDVTTRVSIFGGYEALGWTRDIDAHGTTLRATEAHALRLHFANGAAVQGLHLEGARGGPGTSGPGTSGPGTSGPGTSGLQTTTAAETGGVFVGSSVDVVVADCVVDGGAGPNESVGIDVRSDSRVALARCTIGGGESAARAVGLRVHGYSEVVGRDVDVVGSGGGGGPGGTTSTTMGVAVSYSARLDLAGGSIRAGGGTRTAHGARATDLSWLRLDGVAVQGGTRAAVSRGVSFGASTGLLVGCTVHGGGGGADTVGVYLEDAGTTLVGNVLVGGLGSARAVGVVVDEGAATLVGNTVDAAGARPPATYGVEVLGAAVTLVDNLILAGSGLGERVPLVVSGFPARLTAHGNDLWGADATCVFAATGVDEDDPTEAALRCADAAALLDECAFDECIEASGNLSLDPRLVQPSGGDYHLWSSSPCVDAGVDAAAYLPDGTARDADGDARPFGGAWDIGADEFTGGGDDPGLSGPRDCHLDGDGDGWGDESAVQGFPDGCPPGWVVPVGDCDDEDPRRHPGAFELPDDGVDQDCDGADLVEVDAGAPRTCYRDRDGDGFGEPGTGEERLGECPEGWAPADGDCDDALHLRRPGAPELPDDGVDQDCDGADLVRSDAIGVFVAPDGDDTNTGTMAAPFATVRRGAEAAAAEGKSLFVAAGTWSSQVQLTVPVFGGYSAGDWTRDLATHETIFEGSPFGTTTVVATGGGETLALDGLTLRAGPDNGESASWGLSIEPGASVQLSRATVLGGRGHSYTAGVRARQASSVTIVECTIDGGEGTQGTVGVELSQVPDAVIVASQVDGGGRWGAPDWSHGVWSRGGHLVLRESTVEGGWGRDVAFGVRISNDGAGTLFRNRVVGGAVAWAPRSSGVSIEDATATLVANVIDGGFGTEDARGLAVLHASADVLQNTIFGGGIYGASCYGVYAYEASAALVGNLIDGGRGRHDIGSGPGGNQGGEFIENAPIFAYTSSNELLLEGNDLWGPSLGCFVEEVWSNGVLHIKNCVRSLDEVELCLWAGCAWAADNLDVDPVMADAYAAEPPDGDVRLRAASPCVDAGVDPRAWTDSALVESDADGQPRPWGTGWDIGADEFDGWDPVQPTECRPDTDGDGYGDAGGPVELLEGDCPFGQAANADDCDDADPLANPDAAELPGDGVDQDCTGGDLVPSDAVGVFVAPGGDDAGPGTMDAPMATVGAATARAAEDAKVVFVAAGVYAEDVESSVSLYGGYEDAGWTRDLLLDETTIEAVEGVALTLHATDGRVAVQGFHLVGGALANETAGLDLQLADALVTDNTIEGGFGVTGAAGVRVHGSSSALLARNVVHGGASAGATRGLRVENEGRATALGDDIDGGGEDGVAANSYGAYVNLYGELRLEGCRISGGGGRNSAFGVRVVDLSRVTLFGNDIEGGTSAVASGGVSIAGSVASLIRNTIHGGAGAETVGLHLFESTSAVAGNVVRGGVGTESAAGARVEYGRAALLFNTVLGGEAADGDALSSSVGISHLRAALTLVGNVVSAGTSGGTSGGGTGESFALRIDTPFPEVTLVANALGGAAPTCLLRDERTPRCVVELDEIDACGWKGCKQAEGNITRPPLLMNAATGDVHLAPASPCIDAGVAPDGWLANAGVYLLAVEPGALGFDVDGDARPHDGLWDIGADEFTGAPPCDEPDLCSLTGCAGGPPVDCADGDVCTDDACDPASGCTTTFNTADCDDHDVCTTTSQCAEGACVALAWVDCDDGDVCTDDLCDADDGCQHPQNDAWCDDGDACTYADRCMGGVCRGGTPLTCDDHNDCTADECDPLTGCANPPVDGPCDDDDPCTDGDHCADGACVAETDGSCDDGDPCTSDECDPVTGCQHVTAPDGTLCEDGDPCTVGDVCQAGDCVAGGARDCDDGEDCTDDRCDPVDGCQHDAREGSCDDGDPCTPEDTCVEGQCQGAGELACDDENVCTSDECVPGSGCAHQPADGDCDDGDPCTTIDVCQAGACAGTEPLACDDGVACTVDACDAAEGGCVATPDDAACDDAEPCTTDVCDPTDGCTTMALADGTDCGDGLQCAAGICGCVPSCDGLECGDDGCGGSCGDCPTDDPCRAVCEAGLCAPALSDETLCDGLDDDCDGQTDEDFQVGGVFALDAHCGACGNDCAALTGTNVDGGRCVVRGDVPACEPVCAEGFGDANRLPEDGCECTIVAGPDTVGDGIDQNCDGADGVDGDGDEHADVPSGGDDCDDADDEIFPGAVDFVDGACAEYVWHTVVVPPGENPIGRAALALDAEDQAHLFLSYSGTRELGYARQTGRGAWEVEAVGAQGSIGSPRALALDAAGHAHVAYAVTTLNQDGYVDDVRLEYATNASGAWVHTVVDDPPDELVGHYASIALTGDPADDGTIHIAYSDRTRWTLKYATNVGGGGGAAFVVSDVEANLNLKLGDFSCIASGPSGRVAISTFDDTEWGYNIHQRQARVYTKSPSGWGAETLDLGNYWGEHTALAFDSQGAMHASYTRSSTVMHGERVSGGWLKSALSAGNGSFTTIAVGGDDRPHVAWLDETIDGLGYAARDADGLWAREIVDPDVGAGRAPSIAVGADGRVRIAHGFVRTGADPRQELRLVTSDRCARYGDERDRNCDGVDGVDADDDGFASVASGGADCDDADDAIFPGQSGDEVGDGVDQDCDGVDGVDGDGDGFASVASLGDDCDDTDAGVNPGVLDLVGDTFDANCDGHDGVDDDQDGHASEGSGGGDCDDDDPEAFPGADDWVDGTCYAWDDNWSATETGIVAQYVGAGVDDTGRPHIVTHQYSTLRHWTRDDAGVWTDELVAESTSFYTPNAVDVEGDGTVHIAGHGAGVSHVSNATGAWVKEVVAATGSYPALAVDDAGTVHMCYDFYDTSNYTLHTIYATNATGEWVTTNVDDGGGPGQTCAVAIGPGGVPHLSYAYTSYPSRVYHATIVDDAWVVTEIDPDPTATATGHTSLAVDAAGHAHIVYVTASSARVRYLTNASGAWTAEEIDPEHWSSYAYYPDLAIDAEGHLFLTYWRAYSAYALFAADTATGAWRVREVAPVTSGGRSALALTPAGQAHVAFVADSANDISYARNVACSATGDARDLDCDGVDGHDGDLDGWAAEAWGGADCDDGAPDFHPGADDPVGDGLDQDCNGVDGSDADDDGHDSLISGGDDCDDTDGTIYPGAPDTVGDGVDQDCDGLDGVDGDEDAHASEASGGDDCDDTNPDVHPGLEDSVGNGVDDNCDGIDGVDGDSDGHASILSGGDDCDDGDGAIYPGAPDTVGNGVDNDCDGVPGVDFDGDGVASEDSGGTDCNDRDDAIFPAAPDPLGDGVDQNCDGADGVDVDGDGVQAVIAGGDDCDDNDPDAFPGATDTFGDHSDQDCDGADGVDADGDGYAGEASGGPDCADDDPTVHPGADDGLTPVCDAWSADWVVEAAYTGTVPTTARPVVALDAQGFVHIGHRLGTYLYYTTNVSGAWATVRADSTFNAGNNPSIAVDRDGFVHLTHYDTSYHRVLYVTNVSGVFRLQTVNGSHYASGQTSVAVDAVGRPSVAFYDYQEDALYYSHNRTGAWVPERVDASADVGSFNDLAVEPAGQAHICYYDATTGALRYATNPSGHWETSEVDATGLSGVQCSIAIDGARRVHIAYYDDETADLRYATGSPLGWTLTTLASDGAVGRNPGVALDPDGHAYVLHHIGTSPAGFQVLTNATGDWTELTRFPVALPGTIRIGDLTVDPQGRAHVVYYDTAPDDLIYRTNGSPGASCLTWADDTTSCNAIDDDCDGTTDAGCP